MLRWRTPAARGVVRDFSWLSFGNQVSALSGMIGLVILTRYVPVNAVGQVVFAQAAAAVLMLVLDIRFEDAAQRFYPAVLQRHGRDAANGLFLRLRRWDLLLGCLVAMAGAALWAVELLPSSGVWRPEYVSLALVAAGAGSVVGTLQAGYALIGELSALARLLTLSSILNLILVSMGAVVWGGAGFLAAHVGGVLLQIGLLWFGLRGRFPSVPDMADQLPGGLVRFLAKSSASSSVAAGGDAGVVALAGALGGPAFAAMLKVAQAPGRLVMAAASPVAVQMFPRVSTHAAASDVLSIRAAAYRVSRAVGIVALVGTVGAAIVLRPVIELLYGSEYGVAAIAATLYVAGASCRASVAWSKVLPLAVDRPGLRMTAVGIESGVLLAAVGVAVSAPAAVALEVAAGSYAATGLLLGGVWLSFVRGQWLFARLNQSRSEVRA